MNSHSDLSSSRASEASSAPRPFEFVPGPGPKALKIVFRGFWDEGTLAQYREALRQRALASGGSSSITRVLLDLRDCTVQSQHVVDGMEKIIERYAFQIAQYGMVLPTSALLKAQMKRLMTATPIVYFESDSEAMEWLCSE